MYAQNYQQPVQSTRIPVNAAIRQPAAPRLTDKQLLEKRATARNAMAATEATIAAPHCKAVACDPYENSVSFRLKGQASIVHTVCLNTGECDCVLQEAVNKLNGQLVAERSSVRCTGKCVRIVDLLEQRDPECFLNAPLLPDPFAELLVADATEAI